MSIERTKFSGMAGAGPPTRTSWAAARIVDRLANELGMPSLLVHPGASAGRNHPAPAQLEPAHKTAFETMLGADRVHDDNYDACFMRWAAPTMMCSDCARAI